jgi:hypothetical protein
MTKKEFELLQRVVNLGLSVLDDTDSSGFSKVPQRVFDSVACTLDELRDTVTVGKPAKKK